MSVDKDLFNNIKNWYANTEQGIDIFLCQIVSPEVASQIQKTYDLFLAEQDSFCAAKLRGISPDRWLCEVLQQRVASTERIDGIDLEGYASSLVYSIAQSILYSNIPEADDFSLVSSETIPELLSVFDSPLKSSGEDALHQIAGATLYQYAQKKNLDVDPIQACLIATTGITTAKALYQVGCQKIEHEAAMQVMEEQAIVTLSTLIKTAAPKAGEIVGTAIGAYIGQYVGNAPSGAKIGARLGRMAGGVVATKSKPIAKTIVAVASKVVEKTSSWISEIW